MLRQAEVGTPYSIHLSALNESIAPLLTDFGIALAFDLPEFTITRDTIASPTYMSPEQGFNNYKVDARTNIYSLGIVLYRCLVGRAPFRGSIAQVIHGHVYDPLIIPEDILRNLPHLVIQILQQSLQKEPEKRYENIDLMAEDLSRVKNSL